MGTVPTKLTSSSELVDCPCGASFLAYKSAQKTYCSRECQSLSDEADRKIRSFREETGKTLSLIMQSELPTQTYGGGSN